MALPRPRAWQPLLGHLGQRGLGSIVATNWFLARGPDHFPFRLIFPLGSNSGVQSWVTGLSAYSLERVKVGGTVEGSRQGHIGSIGACSVI